MPVTIAGIKPTSGRVPRSGHIIPYGAGLSDSLNQIGPMARFAEDLVLALSIIACPDWQDPGIVGMPLGDPRKVSLKDLRVAYHTDNGIVTPVREIVEAVRRAAAELSNAGIRIEERRPPGIEQAKELFGQLWLATGGAGIERLIHAAGTTESDISPPLRKSMEGIRRSKPVSGAEVDEWMVRLDQYRSSMLSFMQGYDAIICPVNAYPALAHGNFANAEHDPGTSYTYAHNLTGWPCTVVRGGTTGEGIPIGIQVVAQPWREDVAGAGSREVGGQAG